MKVKDVGINTIEWTAAGTSVEIGFAQSESGGRDDDWTLSEARFIVLNGEIQPFLDQIIERFKQRITWAVELEAGMPISPEGKTMEIAST
jgi:hypothetical protein